jgi:hypothetical protein
MNHQRQRWNTGTRYRELKRHEIHQDLAKVENEYYDGNAAYSEYGRVISDLLKEPVSLGIVGGNSNRGHQR